MVNFRDLELEKLELVLAVMKTASRPSRTKKVLEVLIEFKKNGVCTKRLSELEKQLTAARGHHNLIEQDEILDEMEIELGLM